ncbi:MAG: hypothetical protein MRJ67_15360 [Nitrospirales bacterium]|nr:hypothetical protein [Nitrospirales bacterium]MDR4461872.1 hypothetical protein [Nitrospirales bacterium]MDR4484734.1 hypothetical protein [Nitrospirales bacterium]
MHAQVNGNSHLEGCPTSRQDPDACCRCGGLMKTESVFDLVENEIEFMSARCLQCGDIVDPVILMNRSGKSVLSRSSGRARH